jgi:ADP-ribose pyrophosphatase YjhB (NUDIX family)
MYKIYYNNTAIILTEKKTGEEGCEDLRFVEDKQQLCAFLDAFFENDNQRDICLSGYVPEKMFRDFTGCFKLILAAGGLVMNAENNYLFIKRFGLWDLPKGKMEKGEEPEEAAIREVEEETGVIGLKITGELPQTYHIYRHNEKLILKETYWYRMVTNYSGTLSPQLKEDITEAVWLSREESKKALSESYRSLNETLAPFLEK